MRQWPSTDDAPRHQRGFGSDATGTRTGRHRLVEPSGLEPDRFEQLLRRDFAHRIPGFDEPAARAYGELMAHRRSVERPMSVLDGQIAAIARSQGFALATRNTADCEQTAVDLVNPWIAL